MEKTNLDDIIHALQPIISRVRTDVTAIKRNGEISKTQEPLTDERLLKHLNGGTARGVYPIREGEATTMLALLDFDSHKGEIPWEEMVKVVLAVINELKKHSLKPTPFRSSGG